MAAISISGTKHAKCKVHALTLILKQNRLSFDCGVLERDTVLLIGRNTSNYIKIAVLGRRVAFK